jgi:two-component system nitrogen regulation sensor histidine kinase NtrY
LRGRALAELFPETDVLIRAARIRPGRAVDRQLSFQRPDGQERTVFVRVAAQQAEEGISGFVSTLDDVTELLAAQRKAAWADIARRIAHEIKNPLTPIQLSAERIRRKYGDSITKDREVFDQCTDTIIRQVSDIGRMVDEFSAFARMPKPVMERHDVREIVREAVFLFQVSRPEIAFELDLLDRPVMALSDRRLLTQAVTNLVKNASEAIDSAVEADAARAG